MVSGATAKGRIVPSRRTNLALMVAVACAMAPDASTAAEPILWPHMGVFPAYEREEEESFEAYGIAEATADENVFRVSDTAPLASGSDDRGDVFVRLGAGIRGHGEWSRQQLRYDLRGEHYAFDEFSELDEWLYDGSVSWIWAIGSRLDGVIGYAASRAYPDFAELQFASQDLVDRQYGQFGLNFKFLQRLQLRTLAEGTKYEHRDPGRAELDNEVGSATGGLFYMTPAETSIGVQHRFTQADFPNRQTIGPRRIDNHYEETESSFVVIKPPEFRIGLDLRVGYTERKHEDVPERDFKGATGRAQIRVAPTAKVVTYLTVYRELQAIEDLDASYALAKGASFGPAWAPTLRTVVQLTYVYEERSLEGNPGFVIAATAPREDTTQIARASFGYRPNEHFEAALSYEYGERDSSLDVADFDYQRVTLRLTASM